MNPPGSPIADELALVLLDKELKLRESWLALQHAILSISGFVIGLVILFAGIGYTAVSAGAGFGDAAWGFFVSAAVLFLYCVTRKASPELIEIRNRRAALKTRLSETRAKLETTPPES